LQPGIHIMAQGSQPVERALEPDEVARGANVREAAEPDHVLRFARVPRARSGCQPAGRFDGGILSAGGAKDLLLVPQAAASPGAAARLAGPARPQLATAHWRTRPTPRRQSR